MTIRPPSLMGPPLRKLRVVIEQTAALHPDWRLVDEIPAGPRGKYLRRAYRHRNGLVVELEWIPEAETGMVKATTPEQALIQMFRWAEDFEKNPLAEKWKLPRRR